LSKKAPSLPEAPAQPLGRRLAPLLLFVGLFCAYAIDLPERLYGDDAFYVRWIVKGDGNPLPHLLYLPIARVAARIGALFGADPFLSLRVLSAAAMAGGFALVLQASLHRGRQFGYALLYTLFAAVTPSAWFFATAAEIHAVHLFAMGLLLNVVVRIRSGTAPFWMGILVLALGFVLGTHQSGILVVPSALLFYVVSTNGRLVRHRWQDLAWAGGAAILVSLPFLLRDSGGSAEPAWYVSGLQARLSTDGWWGEYLHFIGTEWVAPAWVLVVSACYVFGSLLRTHRTHFLALVFLLVPYLTFFGLFDYAERGAYFIVLLPLLAAVVHHSSVSPLSPTTPSSIRSGRIMVLVTAAGALLRPEEIVSIGDRFAPWALAALVGFLFLLGVLWPAPYVKYRWYLMGGTGAMVFLTFIGAQRTMAEFDREQPLQDWGRGVAEIVGDQDGDVIVGTFYRKQLLHLMAAKWPDHLDGTWEFKALPGASAGVFDIGLAPTTPGFLEKVGEKIRRGRAVWLESALVEEPDAFPPDVQKIVGQIQTRYTLQPVRSGSTQLLRLIPK